MKLAFEELLSPRISKHCIPLFQEGHYKHAAHEAMIQVEKALKEKGKVKDKRYGQTLISSLFSFGEKKKYIRLRVPLGDNLQKQAEDYFKGVFSFYRNYTAHDGSKIGARISQRIMVIASELLDLIDASSLSFVDLGGVHGLLKAGEFESKEQLVDLLELLENYHLLDGETDGLMETLWEMGCVELQLNAVLELDLIRYHESDYTPSVEEMKLLWDKFPPPDTIGSFELTDLGKQAQKEINQSK